MEKYTAIFGNIVGDRAYAIEVMGNLDFDYRITCGTLCSENGEFWIQPYRQASIIKGDYFATGASLHILIDKATSLALERLLEKSMEA